jgi:polysaccharide biosynthesis protein PslJ
VRGAVAVRRLPVVAPSFALVALASLAVLAATAWALPFLAPLALVVLAVAAARHVLLRWEVLVAGMALVILLIPIRRFTLSSSLPFELEPYRVVVALVLCAWLASLLIDPKVRLHRTFVDLPLVAFCAAALLSLVVNVDRVDMVEPVLTKKLVVFVGFFLTFYLVVSIARRLELALVLLKTLVCAGVVLGLASMYEARTGTNVFNYLPRVLPFLDVHQALETGVSTDNRGSRTRAAGSAQSPIELGAMLVMLLPLALALARATGARRWWVAVAVIAPGAVSSVSRTIVLMGVAVILTALWVRGRHTLRLWPALFLVVPLIHFAVPGTLGTLANSFFPEGGLVAQQANTAVGSGRLATLRPALDRELAPRPFLGVGFGTRVPTDEDPRVPANAPILDNQWLGVLLETGLLGLAAFAWLIGRFIRRTGRAAKHDHSARGWLLAGVTASIAAYAVGMLTFDTFSFTQVTFLFFIVLGIGAALLASPDRSLAASDGAELDEADRAGPVHAVPRRADPEAGTAGQA